MDLSARFIDTVTYSLASSFSDGDLVQGAQATAVGRLEEAYDVITLAGGEERTASFKFATVTNIKLHSVVWVSGATTSDPGEGLRVLRRKRAKTLDGGYEYYILWLGR